MNRARIMSAAAAVALTAATMAAPTTAHAQGLSDRVGDRSLAAVLAADGNHFDHNWSDFDIVDKAVHAVLKAKPHSPVAVLADGHQRLTAFLPTDGAFRRLVTDLTGHRPATERGTFRAVTRAFDVNTIEAVLEYHVVPGATITYKQALAADGARLDTALPGASLRVHVTDQPRVRLRDADPDARNAQVLKRAVNINRGNAQIAHAIDAVLRPVNL